MCEGMHVSLTINPRFWGGESVFFFLSLIFLHTGPKGGSAITGQNKVTYLLAIDPDKYNSISSKWHFSWRLVCGCYIVTAQAFCCETYSIAARGWQIIYCINSSVFPPFTKAPCKKEGEKKGKRKKKGRQTVKNTSVATWELWSFTCK